ncbi:Nif3-like dinuclear metal center hexameric protein [Candidatus Arthromitus sp. SFB-rat-Yit]|uniref:Nif3-like dinuclear metal center hexameric protein n=1 Tax=Candidatus Arthromitus sp. SFB-rat-Yit TaxID=1041504 RepID=UPI000227A55A|nr:Nif3-like dinuclear metal center hexameric protein [Candidatus Arthromitus sp. SFB-rat-Yit]BAK81006.1 NIF3 family protein [Candidatus Arthromitus sp. SFB-rat-Yit]
MKIYEFINKLEMLVPTNLALSYDNVGLLVGNLESDISGVYISLDINETIINKVLEFKINTIITHHPVIFNSIKNLNYSCDNIDIVRCIKHDINVISYHTNLDMIHNGINDELINILEFKYDNISVLEKSKIYPNLGIGRIIDLSESLDINTIIDKIRKNLYINNMRLVNNRNCKMDRIKRICIINGSGNSLIKLCYYKNIDLVITGDITYHTAFEAHKKNLSILDIGHFNSENFAYMNVIKKIFKTLDLDSSLNIIYDQVLTDVYKYI